MIPVNLKSLVEKMTPVLRESLEGAAGICLNHSHYHVELEHWLLKILDSDQTDLLALLEQHTVNAAELARQLAQAIAGFKTGSNRPAALSPSIVDASKNAWLLASVDYGHQQISSGHLLAALLLHDQSRQLLLSSCRSLADIAPESLRQTARALVGATAESARAANLSRSASALTTVSASRHPGLDQYTINLSERARNGELDAVVGRDEEIRQCIDILTRRRQNNPILTGEAGVGKTAVVEGLALRISEGDVPQPLRDVAIRTLDLGLLQAGASVKGEFESRLKSVIEEVRSSVTPIILFIDEAHTMIGAGGKEGQGDAANLLKPALARGELRTIAATTWAEYKKYFERDPALTRRFQVVKVEEPGEDKAIAMMRSIAASLQQHHRVRILDEAIVAAVNLSHRYLPGRQLPDKSVSLLDTACARVSLSQSSTPVAMEACQRRSLLTRTTLNALQREQAASGRHQQRIAALHQELAETEQQFAVLQQQYDREHALVAQIRALHEQIDQQFLRPPKDACDGSARPAADQTLQGQLQELTLQLQRVQGDKPLIQPCVDAQAVAAVIANWTGIPVGKMISNEVATLQNIARDLGRRVIGQSHALEAVAQAISTSRAGLTDPRKPVGVFLFCGTSGVGKTETALALADHLFGGEQNIITINMSEFKEQHKVSMLLGSPPGYVGYGEGGVLTEAVRRKPYSVILLDEMEKAHPGVQDMFYNLFDKGTIKDGEGRDIDFKNTVIIMTSNAGEDAIRAITEQVEERPDPEVLLDNIRPYLLQHFKPAFLGRTNVIAYYPLADEDMMKIAALNMTRIGQRLRNHYGAPFSYDEDVLLHIVARCHEADTGARNIESILNRSLLPALAGECLEKLANDEAITGIHVAVSEGGEFCYRFTTGQHPRDTAPEDTTTPAPEVAAAEV